ncbi:MAG: outer membrane beta-barrel protein [Opitutus sp.]
MIKTFKLAVLASLAATLTAFADIRLNETFTISGYISASAAQTETDGVKDRFMDVDSVKVKGVASFDKVTGTVSMHTFTSHEPVILDAFATYAVSPSTSVTVGNFLSTLGFEAWDYPNMLQISYANTLGAFIPAYQSGVRLDVTSGSLSGGISLLDSVYGPTYYKGDGDLDNGGGAEAFLKFSKGDSSLFAALAVDDGVGGTTDNRYTVDLWAQTKAGATTLAAEYCYSRLKTGGIEADGFFWLLLAMQPLNDKWTITGRVSGGEDESLAIGGPTPSFYKGTISPAVAITNNLGVLLEYSYTKFNDYGAEKSHFVGAQAIFKW